MGIYNFQSRFVAPILAGAKRHTIRAHRKHPDVVGNTLHLYTELRTKSPRLLMRVPCIRIEEIAICSGCSADDRCTCSAIVLINDVELDMPEREKLARLDGFGDFAEMSAFWKGRVPFAGHIIHWKFINENHRNRPGKSRRHLVAGLH